MRLRPVRAKALCSIIEHDRGDRATSAGWTPDRSAPCLDGCVYSIEDVSHGGALLEGAQAVPPGTRVSVRVMLPGADPMCLGARVLRVSCGPRRQARVAVGFSSVSPDDEDRIAEWIVREWSAGQSVACVVAATSLEVRREVTRRLGAIGVRAARARMPIELIHQLERSRREPTVVFLGATLGGCTDDEVATFLAAAYPWVRRVSLGALAALENGTGHDWMHATVAPPWDAEALREQLMGAMKTASGPKNPAVVG